MRLLTGNFVNTTQVQMTITNFQNPAQNPSTPPSVEVFADLSAAALDTAVVTFPAVTDAPAPTTTASASLAFVNAVCGFVVLVAVML